MRRFRESKILKVIALVLLVTFASQQVCFAERTDLRKEGEIGALDVLLAIVSGFLQGLMVNPSWSAVQSFAMCYLVPRGASLLCDAAGIKNPYLRAAIEMGISTGVGAAVDVSAAANVAADSTLAAKVGQVSVGKYASLATRFKNFLKHIGGAVAGKTLNAGVRGLAGPNASLLAVGLLKGAQGAIYGLARTFLYENIQKYDKRLAIFVSTVGGAIISEFAEIGLSKTFGVAFGYDQYGRYAINLKGAALSRELNAQMFQFLYREL
ncbi:MAG: hypothetical protein NTU54_08175, partial [Candidatus Omnitrophica bacterium]|nr:hypothetical protein [Candidatus Omnitrophota bacterium]